MPTRQAGIYAIIDKLANDIIGPTYIVRHEAPAIRMFSDAVTMPDSRLKLHPKDYELRRLGWINDDLTIDPEVQTIITAEAIVAATTSEEHN